MEFKNDDQTELVLCEKYLPINRKVSSTIFDGINFHQMFARTGSSCKMF